MEIFYNRIRPNYEEIVSYGPRWWTEYREMDANYRFAGWTLDLMAYWLERIVNNQFPAYADGDTLRVFERLMGIVYDEPVTLEERRRIVSAYYSGTGHLSRSIIKELSKVYTGCDSEVSWDNLKLRVSILCHEKDSFSANMLREILLKRIPAHIGFYILVEYFLSVEQDIKIRMNMSFLFSVSAITGEWTSDKMCDIAVCQRARVIETILCSGLTTAVFATKSAINATCRRVGIIADIKEEVVSDLAVTPSLPLCCDVTYYAGIEVRKNLWCLDGLHELDGKKTLNAEKYIIAF